MDHQNSGETFSYTYSAKDQTEIRNIRNKYLPPEEDKMEKLRRLHNSTTREGSAISLTVGIVGTLLLGLGMCCCIVWKGVWFIPGIVIGTIGMAIAGIANPLYHKTVKKAREKIAPEVLKLTDELMK